MGTALVQGALRAGIVAVGDVIGTDVITAARDHFTKTTRADTTTSLADLVAVADVLLLCTKPQDAFGALGECSSEDSAGKLLISIAAGITLSDLEKHTPAAIRVIRTMPNTPALIGKGAAGYCLGSRCRPGDEEIVSQLLGAVGLALAVPEKLMDAVTGLSGSGPAYAYLFIEALADAGVREGLPRADALKLAAQTVAGAAEMVIQTGQHPAVLKDMVTSPGGTTIAGLAVLEERNLRSAVIGAVAAATAKSKDLGRH